MQRSSESCEICKANLEVIRSVEKSMMTPQPSTAVSALAVVLTESFDRIESCPCNSTMKPIPCEHCEMNRQLVKTLSEKFRSTSTPTDVIDNVLSLQNVMRACARDQHK